MDERDNLRTVRQLYACLAQGDIPGVLRLLADDVEWHVLGPTEIVPWAGRRRGRARVARLLTLRPETVEVQLIDLRELVAQGATVVVLGREQARIKPTERTCATEWAVAFSLRGGRIASVREYHDTAAWVAAYGGPASG